MRVPACPTRLPDTRRDALAWPGPSDKQLLILGRPNDIVAATHFTLQSSLKRTQESRDVDTMGNERTVMIAIADRGHRENFFSAM